jgi:hypothetical protein
MLRMWKIVLIALAVIVVGGLVIAHFAFPSAYTAMQDTQIGPNVTVSGDKVPTSIKATAMLGMQSSFTGLQPLGQVVEVTPSGPLSAPVTLRFKLSQRATSNGRVLIATRETAIVPWKLMQATVSSDGWYASMQTTHLSWWQPLWYDLKEAATLFKKAIVDGISGDFLTEAEKPQCDNESQARQDNYAITSSAKNTLYWCFGVENGERILKVVNRIRYPLEVAHLGFTAKSTGIPPFELDQLARFAAGKDSIIYPFEEMDFSVDLKPGTKAFISTEFSGLAQSLYQLQVGVTTAIQFITQFGAGVGVPVNGAIDPTKFEKIVEFIDKYVLSPVECASAVKTLNVGKILAGCFDPDKMFEVFGWAGFLLSPLTIAGSLMEFFRSSLDSIGAIIKGDDRYQILITRSDPAAAFSTYIGVWHVHGYDLTIKADSTGMDVWHNGFSDAGNWCNGNDTVTFVVMADGSLTGTITNEWFTPQESGCPLTGTTLQTGHTFSLVHKGDHLLYQTWSDPTQGSNYLCDLYAAGQGWGQCGA